VMEHLALLACVTGTALKGVRIRKPKIEITFDRVSSGRNPGLSRWLSI